MASCRLDAATRLCVCFGLDAAAALALVLQVRYKNVSKHVFYMFLYFLHVGIVRVSYFLYFYDFGKIGSVGGSRSLQSKS